MACFFVPTLKKNEVGVPKHVWLQRRRANTLFSVGVQAFCFSKNLFLISHAKGMFTAKTKSPLTSNFDFPPLLC